MFAFRLNKEYRETYSGGSIVCSALGHTFDIGKALQEGDGVIVTTSEFLGEALAHYDALERVPDSELPQDAKPVEVPGNGATLTAEELTRQESAARGHEIPAEHADEPTTTDEAVAAGERVSGPSEGASKGSAGDSPRSSTAGSRSTR